MDPPDYDLLYIRAGPPTFVGALAILRVRKGK